MTDLAEALFYETADIETITRYWQAKGIRCGSGNGNRVSVAPRDQTKETS